MQANELLPLYIDIIKELLLRKLPTNDGARFLQILNEQFNDSNIHYFHDCLRHLITTGKSTWTINKEEDIDQLNGSLEILDLLEGYFFTAEKIIPYNSYVSACWDLHLIPRDD